MDGLTLTFGRISESILKAIFVASVLLLVALGAYKLILWTSSETRDDFDQKCKLVHGGEWSYVGFDPESNEHVCGNGSSNTRYMYPSR